MTCEAQFMLARGGNTPAAQFHATLRRMSALAIQAGACVEWVTPIPPDSLAALSHVAETGAEPAADAILTVSGTAERVAATVKALGMQDDDTLDRGRSRVFAGRRHSILPGNAPVRLFFGLRRLEKLSRAEFQDYWLNVHADFGRRLIPPYTYHQVHAEAELTHSLAQLSGLPASLLDGIVEVHFPGLDALIAQLMRPEVASEALADERNFIDHARSAFHVYRDPA